MKSILFIRINVLLIIHSRYFFGHIMMKIYVIAVILFFSMNVFATAQLGDILIWNGDTLKLFSNPLELRADYDSIITQILNKIERATYSEIEDDEEERESIISTACWRGYRAEWIVINDSIFLNNIYHCFNKNIEVALTDIFPNVCVNQKLFASWITGNLYLPQGECIQYIHLGYQSIYEQETVLEVENGLLKNYEVFHNRIGRKSAFLEKMLPGEFQEFASRNINWSILPDVKNKIIHVNIGIQPDEQGELKNIIEEYTYLIEYPLNDNSLKANFVTDTNNIFIQESIRIAKLIPEWDVIYQRGEILMNGIMIDFSKYE